MYLKFGSKGEKVRQVQIALEIPIDGVYGRITQAAVKNFQLSNQLTPDGIAGPKTLAILLKEDYSTDLSEKGYHATNMYVHTYHLPVDEYINKPTDKSIVFLHHTAGNHNPYNTIDNWKNDTRGRIATQFVIGGISNGGDNSYDGKVVECFPDENWAYHLGVPNTFLQSCSVGIEICNWGWLQKKDGRFYNWIGDQVPSNQVCELEQEFRGHKYYHNYTDAQIDKVKLLLLHLSKIHDINLSVGLKTWINKFGPYIAFDYFNDAVSGSVRGVLSHSNVRKDKSDIYPHPKLVKMIKSL